MWLGGYFTLTTGLPEDLVNSALTITDEGQGKVFMVRVDGSGKGMELWSIPVMEEYGDTIEATREEMSIDRDLYEDGFLSSFLGIAHPKSYSDAGVSCLVSGISVLEDSTVGTLAEFDFARREAHLVFRMPLASTSPEASPFIYSAVREGGKVYALATIPEQGLCLIRIDSVDSYTLLGIVHGTPEVTWRSWPFRLDDDVIEPVYCSASLSSHDGRLLVCASLQTPGRASYLPMSTSQGSRPNNFVEEPPFSVESVVLEWDIATGAVREVKVPRAQLLPSLQNDLAQVGCLYGTASNTNGVRPVELDVIPRTLRWNAARGGYDLFSTMVDFSVSGKVTDPLFASELQSVSWLNLVDCHCRLDGNLEFEEGLTAHRCSSGLQQSAGGGVKMLASMAMRLLCLDTAGDTYLMQEDPMYMFSGSIHASASASTASGTLTTHSVLGWRRSLREEMKAWARLAAAADSGGAEADTDAYIDLFGFEPALGPVTGLDVRYDADADAYDVALITDERMGAWALSWNYLLFTMHAWTDATIGAETGNGKYAFRRFRPLFRLTKGDGTLCPITVNLHTNAISFFDN